MALCVAILIILGVQGCLAEQAEQRELGPGGENEGLGPQGQPEVNVTKLLETMEAMKDRIIKLEAMEDEIKELKAMKDEMIKLKAMEDETIELKYKLNKVESEVKEQANSTREISESMNNHVSVLRGMSTQSMMLATQSINEVTSLKDKIGAGTALFSVYMTEDNYPTSNQVIPFRGVALNQGGHYSVSTYKFRCPRRGFYYFTFSIYSSNILGSSSYYSSSAAALVLDGNTVARSHSHNYNPSHFMRAQGSNSAVLDCPQGGLVWIQSPHGDNRIYGNSSGRHTTFSGFLLSYR